MIEITTCILTAALIIASVFMWRHLKSIGKQIEQIKIDSQCQNEYFVPYTQFYTDCHQYNLLALRLYVIGVMKLATEKENYELAHSCQDMIAEMEKLISVSANRNKNQQ